MISLRLSSAGHQQHTSQRHNSTAFNTSSASSTAAANGGLNLTRRLNASAAEVSRFILQSKEAGVKDMIMSLGLLCTVSLLLALLSLVFLLKVSPVRREKLLEYAGVYEVTLALGALSLSLDICCLLVCAIQFVFAVKLVRAAHGGRAR